MDEEAAPREERTARLARLAASPVDQESLAVVYETVPASLTGQQQVDFLRLCARVEAHVAARSAQTIAALAGDGPRPAPFSEVEVAVALGVPAGAAVTELHRACRLTTALPGRSCPAPPVAVPPSWLAPSLGSSPISTRQHSTGGMRSPGPAPT